MRLPVRQHPLAADGWHSQHGRRQLQDSRPRANRAGRERMAIALARDIVDGDRIISARTPRYLVCRGASLAQKMHAPNIKLQLGGTCFLVNVSRPCRSGCLKPRPTTAWCGGRRSPTTTWRHSCISALPAVRAYYRSAPAATNKYFVGDKFFAGGIQVDGDGNANMIGLKGKAGAVSLPRPGLDRHPRHRDCRHALYLRHPP